MSTEILILFVGPISFVIGVVCGVAIYRLLWHIDTGAIQRELTQAKNHDRASQDQIFELRTDMEAMRQRIRILEETNNELMLRDRAAHGYGGQPFVP